jgi:hypothetical protein
MWCITRHPTIEGSARNPRSARELAEPSSSRWGGGGVSGLNGGPPAAARPHYPSHGMSIRTRLASLQSGQPRQLGGLCCAQLHPLHRTQLIRAISLGAGRVGLSFEQRVLASFSASISVQFIPVDYH